MATIKTRLIQSSRSIARQPNSLETIYAKKLVNLKQILTSFYLNYIERLQKYHWQENKEDITAYISIVQTECNGYWTDYISFTRLNIELIELDKEFRAENALFKFREYNEFVPCIYPSPPLDQFASTAFESEVSRFITESEEKLGSFELFMGLKDNSFKILIKQKIQNRRKEIFTETSSGLSENNAVQNLQKLHSFIMDIYIMCGKAVKKIYGKKGYNTDNLTELL